MKVVSNAGPLIALGKLGQLGLLLKLYDTITIPRQVYILGAIIRKACAFGVVRLRGFFTKQPAKALNPVLAQKRALRAWPCGV